MSSVQLQEQRPFKNERSKKKAKKLKEKAKQAEVEVPRPERFDIRRPRNWFRSSGSFGDLHERP
eukprot:m.135746 g.135746  ORF g.135746 m.135746 type:complete len:64 (+) comp29816_c1_seq1:86-277(+)